MDQKHLLFLIALGQYHLSDRTSDYGGVNVNTSIEHTNQSNLIINKLNEYTAKKNGIVKNSSAYF